MRVKDKLAAIWRTHPNAADAFLSGWKSAKLNIILDLHLAGVGSPEINKIIDASGEEHEPADEVGEESEEEESK